MLLNERQKWQTDKNSEQLQVYDAILAKLVSVKFLLLILMLACNTCLQLAGTTRSVSSPNMHVLKMLLGLAQRPSTLGLFVAI